MNEFERSILDKAREITQVTERSWPIDEKQGQYLYDLILDTKPTRILELGMSTGYSTLWLGFAAKKIGAHIDTVEMKQSMVDIASSQFKDAKLDECITIHHMTIRKFLRESIAGTYDFIFIDSFKQEYYYQLIKLLPHIKVGTIIVADNIGNIPKTTASYIGFIKEHNDIFTTRFVDIGNGMEYTEVIHETSSLNH